MRRPKHLAPQHSDAATLAKKKTEKMVSQQKVAMPAACTVCDRVRLFLDILVVPPPCGVQQSGTNVTSSFPSPRQVKKGLPWPLHFACRLWVVVTRIVPRAPGLRSDRGLVGHKTTCVQRHWGQGSLALMVLLLHDFTRVPFIFCCNIVRCRNLVNGIKPETAFKC